MTVGVYRFSNNTDAVTYLVTTPLQFVWILLFFLAVPRIGWAIAAAVAFVATVAVNAMLFRRAGREAGTGYTILNGVATPAGRACLRAAVARLRGDEPPEPMGPA